MPNFILYVRPPAASASSWLPRQMPKIGMSVVIAHFSCSIVACAISGLPGPLLMKMPSYSAACAFRS